MAKQSRDFILFGAGAAGFGLLGAIGILLLQGGYWLRFGEWPAYGLGDALTLAGKPLPHTDWAGAQKVMDMVMFHCPLSLLVLSVGFGVMLVCTLLESR